MENNSVWQILLFLDALLYFREIKKAMAFFAPRDGDMYDTTMQGMLHQGQWMYYDYTFGEGVPGVMIFSSRGKLP